MNIYFLLSLFVVLAFVRVVKVYKRKTDCYKRRMCECTSIFYPYCYVLHPYMNIHIMYCIRIWIFMYYIRIDSFDTQLIDNTFEFSNSSTKIGEKIYYYQI